MKHIKRPTTILLVPTLAATVLTGCFTVKTESEIKPIHITMDINLKVDKDIDRSFSDENIIKPGAKFSEVKDMLNRKVAGITSVGMLEPRSGATDHDKVMIIEANTRRKQRFAEIAGANGVSIGVVQNRFATLVRERLPVGSGVWYQDTSGNWRQK